MDMNRIARVIAEVDPEGPDSVGIDFEDIADEEQSMYYRMARKVTDNLYKYAIHTVSNSASFVAVSTVPGVFGVFRHGDPFAVWGEPFAEGEPLHLVIATDDEDTVRALVEALDGFGQPTVVTSLRDWADDEEGAPGHTERDLGIREDRVTWSDWVRNY